MTEELENKLDELLGMKKQIEELTTEKKLANDAILRKYVKQSIFSKIIYFVFGGVGMVGIVVGYICLLLATGKGQFLSLGLIVMGGITSIMAEVNYCITKSKLSILREMKQFELRIAEILKNNLTSS